MNASTTVAEATPPLSSSDSPIANASEQMQEVMETIVPNDLSVTLSDGREVVIYKCKLRHIALVTQLIEGIFKDLGVTTVGAAISVDLQNPQVLLQLISKKADEIFVVVSGMTSLTYEDLVDLDLADGTKVIQEVWTLNQSFFSQTVMPILMKLGVVGYQESPPKDTPEKDSSTPSVSSSKKGGRKRRS